MGAAPQFSAEQRDALARVQRDAGMSAEEAAEAASAGRLDVPAFIVSATTARRVRQEAQAKREASAQPGWNEHVRRIDDARERLVQLVERAADDPGSVTPEQMRNAKQAMGLAMSARRMAARLAPAHVPEPESARSDTPDLIDQLAAREEAWLLAEMDARDAGLSPGRFMACGRCFKGAPERPDEWAAWTIREPSAPEIGTGVFGVLAYCATCA